MPRAEKRAYPVNHRPIPGRPADDLDEENHSAFAIGPDGTLYRRSMFGWLPLRHFLKPTPHERTKHAGKMASKQSYLGPLARCKFGFDYLERLEAAAARQYVPRYVSPDEDAA